MLKTLLPLLRPGDTLGLTIGCETPETTIGDTVTPAKYRVNVLPKLFTLDGETGRDRLALNQPITLTGTLAELDSPEFVATLQRYTNSTTEFRHTIDEVERSHQSAKTFKAATKPAVNPATKGKAITDDDDKTPDPNDPKPNSSRRSEAKAETAKPTDPTPALF